MEYAIEVKDLSVQYESVCALSNINLNVPQKDFMAIIGPNGGGKSTLLRAVLGLVKPSAGTVKVMGKPCRRAAKPIGYVPQFSSFDRRFPISVEDTVLTGRLPGKVKLFHRYDPGDRKAASLLMEKLEISNLRDRQIGQLSGGQLQRVLIARAMASDPDILLLDEPTASVDATSKLQIYEILNQLNKDMTIIVVTHDTGVLSSHVKSIACLNRELFYHGGPTLDSSVIRQVYGCTVDLIAHGVPHRVLHKHKEVQDA